MLTDLFSSIESSRKSAYDKIEIIVIAWNGQIPLQIVTTEIVTDNVQSSKNRINRKLDISLVSVPFFTSFESLSEEHKCKIAFVQFMFDVFRQSSSIRKCWTIYVTRR